MVLKQLWDIQRGNQLKIDISNLGVRMRMRMSK